MKRDLSSYRDPDGYVAYVGEEVVRCVLNDNSPILDPAYRKFFDAAARKGLLVPYEKMESAPGVLGTTFKLTRLPFVSYPYEWGFEQLKEAAIVTLDICLLALEHGLSLKDATAFNVQMFEGRMVFIDHTSFEKTDGMLPWRPYSQFCRHFIAPLLVTSRTGRNANKSFLVNLEGMDLGEAAASLPWMSRFNPSVFVHIYLHSKMIQSFQDTSKSQSIKAKRTGSQKAYLQHLRNVVEKISPPKYDTEWHRYYTFTNYENAAFADKEAVIRKVMAHRKYGCAWDMGGNNGHFSRIMVESAGTVVSMDIDYGAIDLNWAINRKKGAANIYPLVQDMTNPSPALGFGNAERKTIDERSKPDIMFALALVHHLAVTYNVPFSMMAQRFSRNGAELAVEYVDRDDSQFVKLLRSKDDEYDHYNRAEFERAFGKWFDLIERHDIPGTSRTLYHYAPKKAGS
jgi:hypothetical protein